MSADNDIILETISPESTHDNLRYPELVHKMAEIICKRDINKEEQLELLKQQYPHHMYVKALEQFFLGI